MKKGFTLIELLIVIALLGALAVGLLAALDPFEQLKKGTDTGVRNTVSELHGAVVRYYSIKNSMPWTTSTVSTDVSTGFGAINLQGIIDAGELKNDFTTLAGKQLSEINLLGTDQSVTVCFSPKSKSFRSDPNTKYNSDGTEITDPAVLQSQCAAQVNSNTFSCYWCVK
ncbi:prepilin-type N-terminal cleavage/methylation domain-containing protein [Candidatus Roizmanbacteria bacterium]|nr:prepilin-type N-terminal cleavage/methylation domain-containing protein [Candidatus Roizmanbacteria bacterium]